MEMQGWLHVCDIRGVPAHQLSCGHPAPTEWMEKYCCLSQGKIWLLKPDKPSEYCNGDDGSRMMSSCRNNQLNHKAPLPHMTLQDSVNNGNGAGRNVSGDLLSLHVPSNSISKSFLQKKITPSMYRSRDLKTISAGKENQTHVGNAPLYLRSANIPKQILELGSFSSSPEAPEMLNLQADVDAIVRPLHHSILGRAHCFEVVSVNGSRCFCCKSAGEREAWIEKLRRTLNPNLENSRRMENQLSLWVQEAKGIPVRKKYFCEICLDRQLYARTTSKFKEDSTTFWGEYFDFTSIPNVENVTIHLYKDSDKKRKKDKDYVGLINIAIKSLENHQMLEKWYTLSTPSGKNKNATGEMMAMRIKTRFQSFCILPMQQYKELGELISSHYMLLSRAAQSSLSVSKKDELSRILVYIMHATGTIKEFMTEIVMDDVANIEEESLIFRENTIATKAVEHFLKLVGMSYLQVTLGDFVLALYDSDDDCEVDGSRLPVTGNLDHNQKNLQMCCEIAMCKILNSINIFPNELCEVFNKWREHCEQRARPRIASKLITASLFLRLLCPAILNPYLFGLTNELPRPTAARTLTLVAKVIQNLANRSRFGDKEEYMKFMNGFVREQWDQMGKFLNDVTECKASLNGFEGYIDLGKELAKLHAFLSDNLQDFNQGTIDKLSNLREMLCNISNCISGRQTTEPMTGAAVEIEDKQCKNTELTSYMESITVDARLSSATEIVGAACDQSSDLGAKCGKIHHVESSLLEDLTEKPAISMSNIKSDVKPINLPTSGSFNNSNNLKLSFGLLESPTSETDKPNEPPEACWMSHSKQPLSFSNPAYLQSQLAHIKMGVRYSHGPARFSGDFQQFQVDCPAGQYSELPSSAAAINDSSMTITNAVSKMRSTISNGQALPISFSNPLQGLTAFPPLSNMTKDRTQAKTKSSRKSKFSQAMPNAEVVTQGSLLTESGNSKHTTDDSLSSRPSSTSSESSSSGPSNSHIRLPRNKEYSKPVQNSTQGDNLQNASAGEEGCKLTAVATSTSVSVSNARHCTGLKKRQQQHFIPHAKSPKTSDDHEISKSSVTPSAISSTYHTCPSHLGPAKANTSKSHRGKYVMQSHPDFMVEPGTENVIDGEYTPHLSSASRKRVPAFAPSFNASRLKIPHKGKSGAIPPCSSKVATSNAVCESGTRDNYRQIRKSHTSGELFSLHIATPEDIISAEERTAQWVLSSIVPVPKDEKVHPRGDLSRSDIPNYNEVVSSLKADLDTLSARLRIAEDSSKAFTKREEALLEQLKESDLREARLLERLRVSEDRVAQRTQERDEKRAEFGQRFSAAVDAKQRTECGELQEVINEMNSVVSMQGKRIAYLEETNSRLLRKIKELKNMPDKVEITGNCDSSQRE